MSLIEQFNHARRNRRARPPKMPNWKGRAVTTKRHVYPIASLAGKVTAAKGYAFDRLGNLVNLARHARRQRAAR